MQGTYVPADCEGLIPTPSLVMMAEVSGGTLNCVTSGGKEGRSDYEGTGVSRGSGVKRCSNQNRAAPGGTDRVKRVVAALVGRGAVTAARGGG